MAKDKHKLRDTLVENEQSFRLLRSNDAGDLRETLEQARRDTPEKWSFQRVEQAIIDPAEITKMRVRVVHEAGHRPLAVVTLKGENQGVKGAPQPRFEMDLPIDMDALARMNPGMKPSECLNELFAYGGEGVIGKDRFKYKDGDGRKFDIDLYDWSAKALAAMKQAGEEVLYGALALVDVEMPRGKKVDDIKDFPKLLRPFVACTPDGELQDITGRKAYKGRVLSAVEGIVGNTSLSDAMARELDAAYPSR